MVQQDHPGDRIVRPTAGTIERAAAMLRAGRLVGFPTETVYGLGGDAGNRQAVRAIFAAKGRPAHNPLIVHFADAAAAFAHVRADARARQLADRFWPGGLTLVMARRADSPIAGSACAGLDTVAVRVPGHPIAGQLLAAAACPVAAPSANSSGEISPTMAAHVIDSLGDRVEMVLDGGPCPVGVESSVLDISAATPCLLRPGAVSQEKIEAVIGPVTTLGAGAGAGDTAAARPRSPGLLDRHYSPTLPLRLEATSAAPDEALLAFGPDPPSGAAVTLNLSPAGDLEEAARNFYAMLRLADRADVRGIAVMGIPQQGLGLAINDRLRRAAVRCRP